MQVRCSPFVYVKCFEDLRICIQDAVDAGPELDDWEAVHARSIVQRSGDHADATQEMFRRRQAEKEKKEKKASKPGRYMAHLAAFKQEQQTQTNLVKRILAGSYEELGADGSRLHMQTPSRGEREEPRPAGFPQVIRARPRRETWQR